MPRISRSRIAPAACALVALAVVASASGVISTIPHDARWGDNNVGPQGAVTPLTPTSFVACLKGLDDSTESADDVAVLVTGVGAAQAITALPTPYASNWGPWMTTMSATRCAKPGKGPDNQWNTADDVVFVLDRLGSDNEVNQITVGHIDGDDGHRPIALDVSTLVIATYGLDGDDSTDDDSIALITGIGTTNTVTYLSAPFVARYGKSRPVALTPTSFLAMSRGPDDMDGTADDAAYLFTDVGTTNARTTISTPYTFRYGASTPVRLSATRAVVCSLGPDGAESTADDALYVLDHLGTTNVRLAIPVPSIARYGAGVPVAIDANTLVVASLGADEATSTADDAIYLIQSVASKKPKITTYVVGFLDDDAGSRPVLFGTKSIVVSTGGPDGRLGDADDRIAVIANLGKKPAHWEFVELGGLSGGIDGRAVAVTHDSFLVGNGGADEILGQGGDDRISLVTNAFGTPALEHFLSEGDISGWHAASIPQLLGGGRAAFASAGADGLLGFGQDDVFQVISGLPVENRLEVRRMDLYFDAAAPSTPARMSVKGVLRLAGAMPSTTCDVTITIGNAAQTIPSASLKRAGSVWTYSDPHGRKGFITKAVLNAGSRTFQFAGKGVGTGIDTTHEDYVPVAVTYGGVHVADPCVAFRDATGLHHR